MYTYSYTHILIHSKTDTQTYTPTHIHAQKYTQQIYICVYGGCMCMSKFSYWFMEKSEVKVPAELGHCQGCEGACAPGLSPSFWQPQVFLDVWLLFSLYLCVSVCVHISPFDKNMGHPGLRPTLKTSA